VSAVAIIGGGPAGLMAAETLAASGHEVTIYDRMPSVGRKFLLAGRGGLNLTHSEPLDHFLSRYGAAAEWVRPMLDAFSPADLMAWCEGLGQPVFTGSSGRVFPKSFKSSPVLRAWLNRLAGLGVHFAPRHEWLGFTDAGALRFARPEGEVTVEADATLLALGGASWPRLGSDGGWTTPLAALGVTITPLKPANCGFFVGWSEIMRQRHAGEPLKRLALSFEGARVRGEAIITETGLEGGAIYALSAPLRDAIERDGTAVVHIDLRPDLSQDEVAENLRRPRGKTSVSTFLHRAAGLSPPAIALLRESTGGPLPNAPHHLAGLIKAVPLTLTGTRPIARAISSAGGIARDEVDQGLMLKKRPGLFVAGEMLDWEAPTGGYLLQACFSSGRLAAQGIAAWLAR
jgi:uncharacterized flavoprotein (TIGR03862 family)